MQIIQASFFWKNDKPGGLGFTFGMPNFSPTALTETFDGPVLTDYLAASDRQLGTIALYTAQLEGLAQLKQQGKEISVDQALLASFNIIWLVERGLIPNDEFNGYQFVKAA